MNYQPPELENKTYWILGTKLKDETFFNVQVITEYKTYSSLFTKLNNQQGTTGQLNKETGQIENIKNHEIDFYFLEIDLPYKLKPETAPF